LTTTPEGEQVTVVAVVRCTIATLSLPVAAVVTSSDLPDATFGTDAAVTDAAEYVTVMDLVSAAAR
jgi:hypothetical protein